MQYSLLKGDTIDKEVMQQALYRLNLIDQN